MGIFSHWADDLDPDAFSIKNEEPPEIRIQVIDFVSNDTFKVTLNQSEVDLLLSFKTEILNARIPLTEESCIEWSMKLRRLIQERFEPIRICEGVYKNEITPIVTISSPSVGDVTFYINYGKVSESNYEEEIYYGF